MQGFEIFLNESDHTHTIEDSYGTLVNHARQFGINNIPTQEDFNQRLKETPIVKIYPRQAVTIHNTSATPNLIGKGISDPKIIHGKGMGDQRHESWASVVYHAQRVQDVPVVAGRYKGNTILLDGDHRLMAAVLMNKPLMIKIIDLNT